jgi:hypothetical protein
MTLQQFLYFFKVLIEINVGHLDLSRKFKIFAILGIVRFRSIVYTADMSLCALGATPIYV